VKENFRTKWVAPPTTYLRLEDAGVDEDYRLDFAIAVTDEMTVGKHLVLIISTGARTV
jgi:hypothetical protein